MTTSKFKNYFWIIITISIFVLDRVSKELALHYLTLEEPINLLPILNIFFAYNTGAAFSFLNKASGWQEWLFIGIAISISITLIIWLIRSTSREKLLKISLSLILGGTFGNLYDRIVFHKVIDFIDFFYKDWHYPVFNVADSAICVGAFLLFVDIIRKEKKEKKELNKKYIEIENKPHNKKGKEKRPIFFIKGFLNTRKKHIEKNCESD